MARTGLTEMADGLDGDKRACFIYRACLSPTRERRPGNGPSNIRWGAQAASAVRVTSLATRKHSSSRLRPGRDRAGYGGLFTLQSNPREQRQGDVCTLCAFAHQPD